MEVMAGTTPIHGTEIIDVCEEAEGVISVDTVGERVKYTPVLTTSLTFLGKPPMTKRV